MEVTIEIDGKKITGEVKKKKKIDEFEILNTTKVENPIYDILLTCTEDEIINILTRIIDINRDTKILDVIFVEDSNLLQIISDKKLTLLDEFNIEDNNINKRR